MGPVDFLTKLDYSNCSEAKKDFVLNPVSLCLLTNLRTLKVSNILNLSPDYFKSFSHLRTLYLHPHEYYDISEEYFESNYGLNLSIVDSLKELQLVKLYRFDFLNCREIQEKYPHVRFLWNFFEPDIEVDALDYPYNNNYEDPPYDDYFFGCYEGPFSADNKREGNGKMYYKDDQSQDRARYEGTFKNDMREGKGTFFYYDGTKYEGEWKNHLREGKGIEYYPNGWRYEGEFKSDFREGKGTMVYEDGERYEGEFKRGKRDGQGIYYAEGERYEGEFKEDKLEGKGIQFYRDGSRYEGEFYDGDAEGVGVYFSQNGNRYEGQVKSGSSFGKGIIYYPNGNRYEGQFEEGLAVGRGTLILANGEKYEGDAKLFDTDNGVLKID